MAKQVSVNFFDILIAFEGFVKCPYLDAVGIPTIGIGTTFYPGGKKVTMHDVCIDMSKAQLYVISFIHPVEKMLNEELPGLNQNQFDALVSFIYNIGVGGFKSSTLLRKAKVNLFDPSLRAEFNKWNKAGGKVIFGLVKRRKQEGDLYFKSI